MVTYGIEYHQPKKIKYNVRYILTQHYTIEHKELYDITSPINKSFAEKNGFEYISDSIKRCADRNHWWEKIAWLTKLLSETQDGDMIIYEDCDAINLSGDLKTALHDGMEYGMVQMRHGFDGSEIAPWYNAGVIMMINSPTVRGFFNRVWDRNDDNDERSINKELKYLNYKIGDSKSICSLGTEWNCWENNINLTKNICIKSWHGIAYANKLQSIKDFLKINNIK
jgi:hypothetical protein